MEGYPNTRMAIIAKLKDLDKCRDALDRVIIPQSKIRSDEVEQDAKLALWQGLNSSPHGLCKVLELWQTRMQFRFGRLPQGGPYQVYLRSPNSSDPEIMIGKCASLKDVSTMEATLQSCKFDFAKTIGCFDKKTRASQPSSSDHHSELPTTLNTFSRDPISSIIENKHYSCCVGIESSIDDFIMFKGLECKKCNRQVHTECALRMGGLCFRMNPRNGEKAPCHECVCGRRDWNIFGNMLLSINRFMETMRVQQQHATPRTKVMELPEGRELGVVLEMFQKIFVGATTQHMRSLSNLMKSISNALVMNANAKEINFYEWISNIDTALLHPSADNVASHSN